MLLDEEIKHHEKMRVQRYTEWLNEIDTLNKLYKEQRKRPQET